MVLMFRSARRIRNPSQFRDMAARGAWALRNLEESVSLAQLFRAVVAIIFIVIFAPPLFVSYLGVCAFRSLWCKVLESFYRNVHADRSPSVRAATDTHRKQAVVTLLLHVRGKCQPEHIRAKLQEEIVDRRDEEGKLVFPRLRSILTSRWGHYAWKRNGKDFLLDKHVVVGSQLFRGRAVTEANVQDYMSDIVSKALPAELPPWQLVLVPLTAPSTEPNFYALLRLHHLLSDEVTALHEALHGDWGWGPPLIPWPKALPSLGNSILNLAKTSWNDLRKVSDPMTNTKALTPPTLDALVLALVFVVFDAASKIVRLQPWFKMLSPEVWGAAVKEEAAARKISLRTLIGLVCRALSPPRLLSTSLRVTTAVCSATVRAPLALVRGPARGLLTTAARELVFWARVMLDGPRIVVGEILHSILCPSQTPKSLCGRRVVSWSEPTSVNLVERIAATAGVTPVEVLLAACAGALGEHYRRQGSGPPAVPVQSLGSPGVLLLPAPKHYDDMVTTLKKIAACVAATRHQPALLLASAWLREHLASMLPSLPVRLLLNTVTRRYAAILMTSAPVVMRNGSTQLWGYTVDNILLWRPPQANVSVSLSLMRLGPTIRLAVMADQFLWPHHTTLPAAFLAHLHTLAAALDVPLASPRILSPQQAGPSNAGLWSASPEMLRLEEESLVD